MKKTFFVLASLLVLCVCTFCFVSCSESHIDATVQYACHFTYSSQSDVKETGTLSDTNIQDALLEGFNNSGYEVMSKRVVLRAQESESQAKSNAQSVADLAIKTLKTKYPNYKTDLTSSYKTYSIEITLSYDGTDTVIYSETVR